MAHPSVDDTPARLTSAEQQALLALARRSLEARVRGATSPDVVLVRPLGPHRGVFVSIHRRGELRGCLGRLLLDGPLAHAVAELAASVSDSDPRFDAVVEDELAEMVVEISVLTPAQPIVRIEEIVVGRHGLVVEQGARRGLLLPQVAVEYAWDRETFLAHTCLKAGLSTDAWRRGARVLRFEAQVFGEIGGAHR